MGHVHKLNNIYVFIVIRNKLSTLWNSGWCNSFKNKNKLKLTKNCDVDFSQCITVIKTALFCTLQFVDLAHLRKKGHLSCNLSILLVTVSCLKLTLDEKLVRDVKEPELLYPVGRPVVYPKMTDLNKLLKYVPPVYNPFYASLDAVTVSDQQEFDES